MALAVAFAAGDVVASRFNASRTAQAEMAIVVGVTFMGMVPIVGERSGSR